MQQVLQLVVDVLLPTPDLLQGACDLPVESVQVGLGLLEGRVNTVTVLVHLVYVNTPVLGDDKTHRHQSQGEACIDVVFSFY